MQGRLKLENVILEASYPPTLAHHLCDWTVTAVTGEEPADASEYSRWLDSLPSRIETVSILNTLIFQYLVNVLIVAWLLGLDFRSGRFLPVALLTRWANLG